MSTEKVLDSDEEDIQEEYEEDSSTPGMYSHYVLVSIFQLTWSLVNNKRVLLFLN